MPRAVGLGAVQRQVGILQKLLGIVAIAGRHRDADAGADHDRMAVEQIGLADRLKQPPRQQHGILRARQPALDDRELIGVEAGDDIVLAQRRAQALGDAAQQLVADAVAERIVDRLEIVEVEHQHRDLFRAAPRVQQDSSMCWRSSLRFGKPVKPSCWAMKATRASARLRSVMSISASSTAGWSL